MEAIDSSAKVINDAVMVKTGARVKRKEPIRLAVGREAVNVLQQEPTSVLNNKAYLSTFVRYSDMEIVTTNDHEFRLIHTRGVPFVLDCPDSARASRTVALIKAAQSEWLR